MMAVQWRRVCYAMMTFNAFLMVATLIVAVYRFTQPTAQPSACLPGLQVTTARETIQQAVEERQNNYQEAEYFRTKKPQGLKHLAHEVLKPSQSFTRDKDLLWDANHPKSTLQGFQYDPRGYLRVPEDGYYFIYAHLHYMDKPGSRLGKEPLMDYIFMNEKRFVDDPNLCKKLKKKLLFNEQTPCKVVSPAIPLPSSYQGTVVYLKRDDMLSVASCCPENLHNEAEQSYFGVYLV